MRHGSSEFGHARLGVVGYADPVSVPHNPLPAMQRLRSLALLCFAGTALWTIASLIDLPLELRQDGPGIQVTWAQSISFWTPFVLPPIAAALLATAALVWRPSTQHTVKRVAVLALSAAVILLIEKVVAVVGLADLGVRYLFTHDSYVVVGAVLRWGMESALAIAVAWAALRPTRFSESRLMGVAAVVTLIFGLSNASSIARHVSQVGSLSPLLRHWWISQSLEAACGVAAALFFLIAIRQLRQGQRPSAAFVASWMLLLVLVWLCGVSYGVWRPDWSTLSALRRFLVVSAMTGSSIGVLAAGFAYLVPLRSAIAQRSSRGRSGKP
jgi:hypothetical protein